MGECAQVGSVTTREGFTMVYDKTKHTHRVLHKYTPTHTRLSRRAVPTFPTESDGNSDDLYELQNRSFFLELPEYK